jgi:hypothetical protein
MIWYFITPLHSFACGCSSPAVPPDDAPKQLLDVLGNQKVQLTLSAGILFKIERVAALLVRKNSCGRLLGESRPPRANPMGGRGMGDRVSTDLLDAPSLGKVQSAWKKPGRKKRSGPKEREPSQGHGKAGTSAAWNFIRNSHARANAANSVA